MQTEAKEENWPLKNVFRISRGERAETNVVVVTVSDGEYAGHGECIPIRRYNQDIASVLKQIELVKSEEDLDRHKLQKLLPAGAARHAVDCAPLGLGGEKNRGRVWGMGNITMEGKNEASLSIG